MTLVLAIQKNGRLSEKSRKLLEDAGIQFENGGKNSMQTQAANFPLKIYFLRDDDIPRWVEEGIADAGIVGENILQESGKQVILKDKLGFARCRLSLAVPKNIEYDGIRSIEGWRIATSYPNILKNFLREKRIKVQIQPISGSTEIAPGIGFADGIFDVVSTGSTLLSNGLKEVETVMTSQAVLIAAKNLDREREKILNELLFRIRSVKKARNFKYILLNAPNEAIPEISRILPGMKSPTIMPLAEADWSSLHSVVAEDDFWEIIGQLKAAGAQGILVIPIEKMIL
ncbi:MAG: ATP phosphoribosyltransferase [Calditrichia bacterium]